MTAEDIFGKIKQYLSGNGVLYSFIFAAGALGDFRDADCGDLGFLLSFARTQGRRRGCVLDPVVFSRHQRTRRDAQVSLKLEPVLILLTALGTLPLLRRVTKRGKN